MWFELSSTGTNTCDRICGGLGGFEAGWDGGDEVCVARVKSGGGRMFMITSVLVVESEAEELRDDLRSDVQRVSLLS
eukprot:3409650-Rhodomonas_salina.1